MPKPTKGARLGGSPAHERLMLANLATSLFDHGRITTTEAKAKRLRPFAERLITKARRADLHNRREIMRVIRNKDIVHKLVAEIGPQFVERPGGYTRITKAMPRKGDNAPMAVIELVTESTATAEAERARRTRFAKDKDKPQATQPTAAATPAPAPSEEPAAAESPATEVPAAADSSAAGTGEPEAEPAPEQEPAAGQEPAAEQEPDSVEAQSGRAADKGES